jgi:hypothetical protein
MQTKPKTNTKRKPTIRPITGLVGDTFDRNIRARETAAATKLDLTNLDLAERAFLGTCQDIYRSDIGCYTPFESFFLDLVHSIMRGNAPTLESIRAELAEGAGEFISNWDRMSHGVKRFIQNYPELLADLQKASKGEAAQLTEAAQAT